MYKSGAFSQNTAATSSRSSQVEPSSETPLGAPNVREKLSGSAAALFQRFGYAHVSVRDITSSIDIPKGTFYNHFKSKEALASAILSQHFDALMESPWSKRERDRWSPSQAALRVHRTFDARAWSVPTPAHQHSVGGGSGAPLSSRTADRRRCPALEH
jgi:AcrR family transcriptional regulator